MGIILWESIRNFLTLEIESPISQNITKTFLRKYKKSFQTRFFSFFYFSIFRAWAEKCSRWLHNLLSKCVLKLLVNQIVFLHHQKVKTKTLILWKQKELLGWNKNPITKSCLRPESVPLSISYPLILFCFLVS